MSIFPQMVGGVHWSTLSCLAYIARLRYFHLVRLISEFPLVHCSPSSSFPLRGSFIACPVDLDSSPPLLLSASGLNIYLWIGKAQCQNKSMFPTVLMCMTWQYPAQLAHWATWVLCTFLPARGLLHLSFKFVEYNNANKLCKKKKSLP